MVTLGDILRLMPDSMKNRARIWAEYSLTWLPLLASTTNIKASITTQDDSDFIMTRIEAYATTNASPPVEVAAPQATFTLQVGSNQIFPDGTPVHVGMINDNATKDGGQNVDFPTLVPAQTTLQAFANNLTATDIMLRISVWGIRVFNYDRGDKSF